MTGVAPDLSPALRFEVSDFYTRYAECLDDGRFEDWPSFFSANATYRVTTRENHDAGMPLSMIYCNGRGMMQDRISALRMANIYEPHVYCHMTSGLRVESQNGPDMTVRSAFSVMRTMTEGASSVFACGRSFDVLTRESGARVFRQRLIILDSRQIHTLLVIPL